MLFFVCSHYTGKEKMNKIIGRNVWEPLMLPTGSWRGKRRKKIETVSTVNLLAGNYLEWFLFIINKIMLFKVRENRIEYYKIR